MVSVSASYNLSQHPTLTPYLPLAADSRLHATTLLIQAPQRGILGPHPNAAKPLLWVWALGGVQQRN